jgi:hypothetical protein
MNVVDFRKVALPFRELKMLPEVERSKEEFDVDGVAMRKMKLESLAPLTMFAERGRYGGHLYQPKVNHREVMYKAFVERTKFVHGHYGERERRL